MADRLRLGILLTLPVLLLAALVVWASLLPPLVDDRSYVVRVTLPDGGARLALPPVAGPPDASLPLVVIDPGHGGADPGAVAGPWRESQLVLGLARALRDELLAAGGVRVALTRDRDRFLALAERVEIARALGADLFLSIHADSAGEQKDVRGASIYVLSEQASSEAAARYARRENRADLLNGVDLATAPAQVDALLVELAQRRSSAAASGLVDLILREGEGLLHFHPQPKRSAALAVLRAPDIPSVLFEAGFVSNPDEAEILASPDFRRRFAEVMARAIRIHLAREAAAVAGQGG